MQNAVEVYHIVGDQTDSFIKWKDRRNSILRSNQISDLVDAALDDFVQYDLSSPIKKDQLKGIASVLTSFIAIAG